MSDESSEWARAQLRRDARLKENRMILDRIHGLPANVATAETDRDPRNPNIPSREARYEAALRRIAARDFDDVPSHLEGWAAADIAELALAN